VICFEKHVSEVVFTQHPIWNFLGNWFVKAHIHCNTQAKETEIMEIDVSFTVRP
jgi:hypothetical protein